MARIATYNFTKIINYVGKHIIYIYISRILPKNVILACFIFSYAPKGEPASQKYV